MKELTVEMSAIIPCNSPSPIAYINVFESGDIWLKIKDCTDCPAENKAMCCRNCPVFNGNGCTFHDSEKYSTNKPYQCIVKPTPDQGFSYCQLEFVCVQGSKEGKVRKLNESLDKIEK